MFLGMTGKAAGKNAAKQFIKISSIYPNRNESDLCFISFCIRYSNLMKSSRLRKEDIARLHSLTREGSELIIRSGNVFSIQVAAKDDSIFETIGELKEMGDEDINWIILVCSNYFCFAGFTLYIEGIFDFRSGTKSRLTKLFSSIRKGFEIEGLVVREEAELSFTKIFLAYKKSDYFTY